jgi:hypothetical protein
MNDTETTLVRAAIRWWIDRRPHGWDLPKHLKNPTVNMHTTNEEYLGKAIAEYLAPAAQSSGDTGKEPK